MSPETPPILCLAELIFLVLLPDLFDFDDCLESPLAEDSLPPKYAILLFVVLPII